MCLECLTQNRAHGNDAITAPRLRRSKLSVRVRLEDLNAPAQEVNPTPLEREDLSDPHAGEYGGQHNGAARLLEVCDQRISVD